VTRADYAVHEIIAMWQNRILEQLTSPLTLSRLYDTELKIPSDKDAFTTAELLSSLTDSVFSEVKNVKTGDYTNRKPAVSSVRRNLQRMYLKRLSTIALGASGVPDDCQSIATDELTDLKSDLEKTLKGDVKLDSYTKAHLRESAERISKVLDSVLTISKP
jgi:hypothetical protein